jgi:hypothetical protein
MKETINDFLRRILPLGFILYVICFFSISLLFQFILPADVWAWGPGIHASLAFGVIGDFGQVAPAIAGIIRAFPLEYLYGSLAADFFVGKGQKQKQGHSHNWETGFRFLSESGDDREAAYAYGFLSHLAADVIAHNYFIPELIHRASAPKLMGHLYWEVKADRFVGPFYTRLARDVLTMERLGCDSLLRVAVGKRFSGIRARRHIYTQSVKVSGFLAGLQSVFTNRKGTQYQASSRYLAFMIDLSYRLVRDFLRHPESSPCLSHDPIGSRNLGLACRKGIVSRLRQTSLPAPRFVVDDELLEL